MQTLNEVQKFYGYLAVSELRGMGYGNIAKAVDDDEASDDCDIVEVERVDEQ